MHMRIADSLFPLQTALPPSLGQRECQMSETLAREDCPAATNQPKSAAAAKGKLQNEAPAKMRKTMRPTDIRSYISCRKERAVKNGAGNTSIAAVSRVDLTSAGHTRSNEAPPRMQAGKDIHTDLSSRSPHSVSPSSGLMRRWEFAVNSNEMLSPTVSQKRRSLFTDVGNSVFHKPYGRELSTDEIAHRVQRWMRGGSTESLAHDCGNEITRSVRQESLGAAMEWSEESMHVQADTQLLPSQLMRCAGGISNTTAIDNVTASLLKHSTQEDETDLQPALSWGGNFSF